MRALAIAAMICAPACAFTPGATPHGTPDASGVELTPPGSGSITVTVTVDGAAVAAAPVYFQAADSTLVEATETDATGSVGATLADGGFVTVLLRASADGHDDDGIDRLATFAGVRAGDELRVDVRPPAGTHGVLYATTLATLVPGAASYLVFSACSDDVPALDATGAGSIALIGCGSATDLVIVAVDGDGNSIAAAALDDQPLVDPGVPADAAVGFATAPLLLAPSFGPFVDGVLAVANAPATFASVAGTLAVLAPSGQRVFEASAAVPLASGAATIQLQRPPLDAAQLALAVADLAPAATALGDQRVDRWGAAAAAYAIDVGAALLPEYSAAPSYSASAHAIAWSETAGATPDLVRAELRGFRDDAPEGRAWSWRVIAARGTAPSLALPQLPFDGRFDYNPRATDTVAIPELTSATLPGGYDANRARGFGDLEAAIDPAAPGTLVIETLAPAR